MPQTDGTNFASNGPALGAFYITPSNSANATHTTRAIYVGGAGNLKVTTYNGEVIMFTGLLAGNYYPIVATKVWSSDTSATNLIGLY